MHEIEKAKTQNSTKQFEFYVRNSNQNPEFIIVGMSFYHLTIGHRTFTTKVLMNLSLKQNHPTWHQNVKRNFVNQMNVTMLHTSSSIHCSPHSTFYMLTTGHWIQFQIHENHCSQHWTTRDRNYRENIYIYNAPQLLSTIHCQPQEKLDTNIEFFFYYLLLIEWKGKKLYFCWQFGFWKFYGLSCSINISKEPQKLSQLAIFARYPLLVPTGQISIYYIFIYFMFATIRFWYRYLLLLYILNLWVNWTLKMMIWPLLSSMLCCVSLLEYYFYFMSNWTHSPVVLLLIIYLKDEVTIWVPFNNIKPNFMSDHFSITINHHYGGRLFVWMTIISRIDIHRFALFLNLSFSPTLLLRHWALLVECDMIVNRNR